MNYVPSVGIDLEFIGTPEGDFCGKVTSVNHAARFAKMFPVETPSSGRFGATNLHDPCYVCLQEWQICVDVTHASELQEFGVPLLR